MIIMDHKTLRKKFLDFFEKRGHKVVPSSSLIPTDPSVLFTTAGMQQFKPYYTGDADAMKDFGSLNVASIQRCLRTSDIDEVGDESHLTFFEMLGNFSFGGYGKKEAIEYAYEFIKELGLKIDYVSVFGGGEGIPADEESEKIWQAVNPLLEIKKTGRDDNFWGPTGDEGPCGPTTEIFINGVEIWNIVFNQYFQEKDKTLRPIKLGIDTGMGFERLLATVRGVKNIFETDLFLPIIELLPGDLSEKNKRIIADHLKAATFLLAEGVKPSNKGSEYVLRRLIRKVVVFEHLNVNLFSKTESAISKVMEIYSGIYPELNNTEIISEFKGERDKFNKTSIQGIKEAEKITKEDLEDPIKLGNIVFHIHESFGLPPDATTEILRNRGFDNFIVEDFKNTIAARRAEHQEISRAGAEKKFGGHGLILDTDELKAGNEEELAKVTRLHTATHLLLAALREVFGQEIEQRGSDITPERLRFDFNFPRKLSFEELKRAEDIVDSAIAADMTVSFEEMDLEDAKKSGARFLPGEKYPEKVKVYFIGALSKELCGGPHVSKTSEIGTFIITKEEAVSAGIRRIRAIVK
ncbi:MAG: alanyl-tRNA synthetase [Parcubacteria group bacterium Licking1014_17]|nr:MAG: alanyl-tRNA synthetase [Parcubacteria group bacterium Licking1014_17]